jgi:signal transduction histidine kinase
MVTDRLERRIRGEEVPGDYVTRGLRKDGTEFDLEIHASSFHVNGECFRLVILRDVTETTRAQEEKRKAHEELERRVAERTADLSLSNARLQSESLKRKRLEQAMWNAIDREQKRIGEDLHDSLGQQLAGISCSIKAIKAPGDPVLAASLERVARLLCDAVAQTRRIARGLYPPELDDGLLFALKYLSDDVTHSFGVKCSFAAPEMFHVRESDGRQLYRIAQEAISNSLKHGHASQIDIELVRIKDVIRLTIRDNGAGLPAPGSLRPGMGLNTMRNRARVLGGNFVLKRDADGGTVVRCWYHEAAH